MLLGRIVLAAVCFSMPALADQKDVAAQFFEAGVAAAKRKDFRVCAEAFAEAHRRAPHGAAVYNAALCWESAKELPLAANGYAEAIERIDDLSPAEKIQARARLDKLANQLGRVQIEGPEGSKASVGPLRGAKLPAHTFVEPGSHIVEAESRSGAHKTIPVEVAAGETRTIAVEFPVASVPSPKSELVTKPASQPEVEQPATRGTPWQVPAGWVGVGAGVVTAGVGVGFYLAAVDARDEFDRDRSKTEPHDRAESRLQTARILGVAGGVLAGVGVTLLLTAGGDESEAARVRIDLGPASAHAGIRF